MSGPVDPFDGRDEISITSDHVLDYLRSHLARLRRVRPADEHEAASIERLEAVLVNGIAELERLMLEHLHGDDEDP